MTKAGISIHRQKIQQQSVSKSYILRQVDNLERVLGCSVYDASEKDLLYYSRLYPEYIIAIPSPTEEIQKILLSYIKDIYSKDPKYEITSLASTGTCASVLLELRNLIIEKNLSKEYIKIIDNNPNFKNSAKLILEQME
jgi:hypothetical protein